MEYIIPAAATVVVAVIETLAARERRQLKAEKQRREAQEQAREELLIMLIESTGAAIALGEATAHAMQRGHTNGDMEKALEYAAAVKHRQKEFLAAQGVHAMWD